MEIEEAKCVVRSFIHDYWGIIEYLNMNQNGGKFTDVSRTNKN